MPQHHHRHLTLLRDVVRIRDMSAGAEALGAQVAAAAANSSRGHEDNKCRGNTWPFPKLRVDVRPHSDFRRLSAGAAALEAQVAAAAANAARGHEDNKCLIVDCGLAAALIATLRTPDSALPDSLLVSGGGTPAPSTMQPMIPCKTPMRSHAGLRAAGLSAWHPPPTWGSQPAAVTGN